MCYLCGPDKARKSIDAALRVWKRKTCGPECSLFLPVSDEVCQTKVGSWGNSHDWTKPPTKAKRWTPRDFALYQKRTRYQSRATTFSFVEHGGIQCPSWGDTHDWAPKLA